MKSLFRNFFGSLPLGARLLLLVYLLGFPLALAGHATHTFELYNWLGLSPALVWKGQVWRMVTYGFLPAGVIDWVVGTFWLATLVLVVGRSWTSLGLWGYCVLGILAGALPIVLLKSGMEGGLVGIAAMVFALLVAWDWLFRNERLILLGIGELSVRQAAMLIAIINSIILVLCVGWFFMLAMWCGGLAGGFWLWIRSKLFLGKTARQLSSDRMARLEL